MEILNKVIGQLCYMIINHKNNLSYSLDFPKTTKIKYGPET